MEHVVFFPAPDGAPVFRRVATLEEAVRLVEHLRNVEAVAEVAVHPLGPEVPLAFRAYYRVEVPASVEPAGPAAELRDTAPAQPVEAVAEHGAPEPVRPADDSLPVLVDAAPNGHSGDGAKSLGFFA